MIYVAPGASFEAVVEGFPTGLAGTLGVRILDNAGGTHTARTTAGIAEFPAGSGRYEKALVAPTVAGHYSVYWDDGGSRNASEDLVVTASAPAPLVLSGRALVTLAEVKEYLDPDDPTDASRDGLLTRLINAASIEFQRVARREIRPIGVNPQTRLYDAFDIDANGELPIHDLATFTSAKIDDVAVAAADVVALPRVRNEWDPITDLRLRSLIAPSDSIVAVTGDWGFPLVPEDVRDKVIKTVATWANRDVERYSDIFVSEEGQIVTQRSLPSEAYTLAVSLRRNRGALTLRVGGRRF